MLILRLLLFLFVVLSVHGLKAAINPVYKDCMQRGYAVDGDSCVFPDGSKCLLEEFNSGECGQAFFNVDYCVPEGGYVWDGPCCEGLEPYLPEGVAGQATCQPVENVLIRYIRNSWLLWGLLVVILIAAFTVIRKKGKRQK